MIMTKEDVAKIIEAEAGILDYNGKLMVGNTIVDNDFNTKAFTIPCAYCSSDSLKAAEESIKGVRRYPGYKVLQFRSFKKYSDGKGHPDLSKIYSGICPMPRNYFYLGADYVNDEWGSFAYGVQDVDNPTKKVKVIYDGSDGVSIRSQPCMGNNVIGVAYKDYEYTVSGMSDDGQWIQLLFGGWITSNPYLTKTYQGNQIEFQVRIMIDDLNIRRGAGVDYDKFDVIKPGVYTIVETMKGKGSKYNWGLLMSYSQQRNGWISLDYCDVI